MKRSTFLRLALAASASPGLSRSSHAAADKPRKLVLIAGQPSHPPMMHEFRAGTILLEKRLAEVPGLKVDRHELGWVTDEKTFDDADAVVCFSDGNGRHPLLQGEGRLDKAESLVSAGVGFGCMHFGVEVPKDTAGSQFRDWIGGCYENQWSCNPIWDATFDQFPEHPITRGMTPFTIKDEWYFNMRFRNDNVGEITPLLIATPSDKVRNGPYVWPKGPYKHIQKNKGRSETMMWSYVRENEGRGFGFTGGHKHVNWGNDNYRKAVLNGLLWIAKAKVPTNGVKSTITDKELKVNLDKK